MILPNIAAASEIAFLISSFFFTVVRKLSDISDPPPPPLSDISERLSFYRLSRTIQTVPEL
jgi:hypothetical protein